MPRLIFSDSSWSKLLPLLTMSGISNTRNLRITVEGIFWRIRTGSPWRDLPDEFGPWSSVFNRFNEWSRAGKLARVFDLLKKEPDLEFCSIDGSIVRAHQHSSGAARRTDAAIGSSRGGRSTKIHMIVDSHGNPLHFEITEGQRHDVTQAESLIEVSGAEVIICDKGYDSENVRQFARNLGIVPIIPKRQTTLAPNPEMDYEVYKWRHLVENAFAKIKHYRAVATRYDQLARNYRAVLSLVCARHWLALI